jgi:hypothetical protein
MREVMRETQSKQKKKKENDVDPSAMVKRMKKKLRRVIDPRPIHTSIGTHGNRGFLHSQILHHTSHLS